MFKAFGKNYSLQVHRNTHPDDAEMTQLKTNARLELENTKLCTYTPYQCSQLCVDNYSFCVKHILNDKTAPYKQCTYVYTSNGKRCYLPAPRGEKKDLGYCNDHALKTHLVRAKQGTRAPPPRTAETLLHSLSHYVKRPKSRANSSSSTLVSEEGRISPDDGKTTKCLDPFVDIDAGQLNTVRSDVLDLCSESESDVEATTLGTISQDYHADSSDEESVDSETEDPLKFANIFTAEEITLITRDKLIRLQSLYIEQYNRLQYVLREKRRKYLIALKREKETCCSISNQAKDNSKEKRIYKKFKAYNHYHKSIGDEAILRKRLNEMRLKVTDGAQNKPQSYQIKCAFMEGGVKCSERALPVARHCRKHILEDPNQVLFRACGRKRGDIECNTPVETVFDDATCVLHRDIPVRRSYSQFRKDSESDYEESIDLHPNNPNVKTERMDYTSPIDIPSNNILRSFLEDTSHDSSSAEMQLSQMNDIDIDVSDEQSQEGVVSSTVDLKECSTEGTDIILIDT